MEELEQFRNQVDEVDELILKTLNKRAEICVAIGEIKKKNGMPVKDISRENEVYNRAKQKAVEFHLDPMQVEAVFREIVNMCSAVQE